MINTTEYAWNDYIFYIRPMEPFTALILLGDLQGLVLPAIGAAIGIQDTEEVKKMSFGDIINKTNIDIGKGVAALSNAISGHLLKTHLNTILTPEYISVKIPDADEAVRLDKARQMQIFSGHTLGMLSLAKEVLKVNFADFFTIMDDVSGSVTQTQQNPT